MEGVEVELGWWGGWVKGMRVEGVNGVEELRSLGMRVKGVVGIERFEVERGDWGDRLGCQRGCVEAGGCRVGVYGVYLQQGGGEVGDGEGVCHFVLT